MADYPVPDDPLMSAVHFLLEVQPTGVRVRDLQSSNGTVVNGERITEATLDDGALIVAGRTVFKITFEDAPAKPRKAKEDRVRQAERFTDADPSAITAPNERAVRIRKMVLRKLSIPPRESRASTAGSPVFEL